MYVDEEISIGDYVMSSGEVAATVIIDCVYRLVDDVITHESLLESGRRFSVLKINISNFRSINDAYTHACGDFILTKIGHLLLDMENDDYCIARDNSEFICLANIIPMSRTDWLSFRR